MLKITRLGWGRNGRLGSSKLSRARKKSAKNRVGGVQSMNIKGNHPGSPIGGQEMAWTAWWVLTQAQWAIVADIPSWLHCWESTKRYFCTNLLGSSQTTGGAVMDCQQLPGVLVKVKGMTDSNQSLQNKTHDPTESRGGCQFKSMLQCRTMQACT